MTSRVEQLKDFLHKSKRLDGKGFSDTEADLLSKYYELVLKWNSRLHLTTLTQPREFFERHIWESAFSESFILPVVNQVWDLGSGLGIPGMVIAILRPDIAIHLVEVSRNKAIFLREAAGTLGLNNVEVVESRFETIDLFTEESCLAVRAIESMEKMIPIILRLGAGTSQVLIFGAKNLEEKAQGILSDQHRIECVLIPGSNRRYLINIFRST
ncbi:MAG: 16S rRNA (guanine(527)-N(7))-methyltransferase RsmG [Blastocatellales bacterium]